jgi:hypothetical protein
MKGERELWRSIAAEMEQCAQHYPVGSAMRRAYLFNAAHFRAMTRTEERDR